MWRGDLAKTIGIRERPRPGGRNAAGGAKSFERAKFFGKGNFIEHDEKWVEENETGSHLNLKQFAQKTGSF